MRRSDVVSLPYTATSDPHPRWQRRVPTAFHNMSNATLPEELRPLVHQGVVRTVLCAAQVWMSDEVQR